MRSDDTYYVPDRDPRHSATQIISGKRKRNEAQMSAAKKEFSQSTNNACMFPFRSMNTSSSQQLITKDSNKDKEQKWRDRKREKDMKKQMKTFEK